MPPELPHSIPSAFPCIMVDFPWQENGGGKSKRGADRHYPTVKASEGPDLIRSSPLWRPAPNAHLYFWVTNNYLIEGLAMIKALGFRYVTNIPWVKVKKDGTVPRKGLGQYTRGAHELLLYAENGEQLDEQLILFGVQGKGRQACTPRRDIPSILLAQVGRHSEKPSEAYELAEARTIGPRASIFERAARPGWWVWGDELGGAQPPLETM